MVVEEIKHCKITVEYDELEILRKARIVFIDLLNSGYYAAVDKDGDYIKKDELLTAIKVVDFVNSNSQMEY